MTNILFVCLGNICRSSMAEAVLKQMACAAGRADDFRVESAGTSNWHVGQPPDRDAQATALSRGYDLSAQRARQLAPDDFHKFDMIIAMDDQNKADLIAAAPAGSKAEISLLMDYAPGRGERNVPDPWSCGRAAFDHALDLVEAGCAGLLQSVPSTEK